MKVTVGKHTYEGTGSRHEKTQKHMVIQKDIKEDTEEHLGMHKIGGYSEWHRRGTYDDIVGEHKKT